MEVDVPYKINVMGINRYIDFLWIDWLNSMNLTYNMSFKMKFSENIFS